MRTFTQKLAQIILCVENSGHTELVRAISMSDGNIYLFIKTAVSKIQSLKYNLTSDELLFPTIEDLLMRLIL